MVITQQVSPAPGPGLVWHGLTDRGRVRPNNEDAFLGLKFNTATIEHLGKTGGASLAEADFAFAVSDGMGGALAGEYASRVAVDKIATLLPRAFRRSPAPGETAVREVFNELFRQIHGALRYLGGSYDECAGMGATLSVGWFTPGKLWFGHVGDSRIYHLPAAGGLRQITEDDTFVGWLYRQGAINEREARTHPRRNLLQKALGGGTQFVEPQVGEVDCQPGDRFLFCTDGLSEGLFDQNLLELLRPEAASGALIREPVQAGVMNPAQTLVAAAVARDGRDNITALVVDVC